MFPRAALLATASMVILAAVTPAFAQSCNGGAVQCCNAAHQNNAASAALVKSLVGIDVGNISGLIGITCSPVTGIGASGTSCSQQQVCCTNNSFNGVVALGCTPININA